LNGALVLRITYNPSLSLYHGTIDLYSDIISENGIKIFPRNKGGVDFGPGFYLTTNFDQAKEWAKRRTAKPIANKQILELASMTVRDFLGMKEQFKPVVLKYEIKSINNWLKFNHNKYEVDDKDWKEFVWIMRQVDSPLEHFNFHWIYGPVADGGLLSADYKDIKAYSNKDQLAVLTNEAAKYLKITGVLK
jgi:hypothetical protein